MFFVNIKYIYVCIHREIEGKRGEREYNSSLKEGNSTNDQNTTVLYKLKMNYTSKDSPKSTSIFDNYMDIVIQWGFFAAIKWLVIAMFRHTNVYIHPIIPFLGKQYDVSHIDTSKCVSSVFLR